MQFIPVGKMDRDLMLDFAIPLNAVLHMSNDIVSPPRSNDSVRKLEKKLGSTDITGFPTRPKDCNSQLIEIDSGLRFVMLL